MTPGTNETLTVDTPTIADRTRDAETLATRVKTHLEKLDALVRSLPDPNDEPTPNRQERAARAASAVDGRRRTLRFAFDIVQTCDRRAAPLREWHGILLDAEREFDRQRAALDVLPGSAQRERFREVDAVRDSLKVIRNGVEWVGDMALVPNVLGDYLRSRGVQPEPGQRSVFGGRSSLRWTEGRLAELDGQRAEAISRIEAELATPVEAPNVAAT